MSHTAVVITTAYAIAVVIGVLIAVALWRSTHRRAGQGDVEAYSHREAAWFVIMVVALFALLLGTIFYVPYGDSAGPGKQVVRVTAVQFAWAIDPPAVKAGRPVEFWVSTRDVNHGFGVYDADHRLQFQVQAMPGETQKVVHTFSKPGTYDVWCLEFCGSKHHDMVTTLEVEPA